MHPDIPEDAPAAATVEAVAGVGETHTHELLTEIAHRVYGLNARLRELALALKAAQPKRPGAVTLELHDCGHGCIGCPHPRWTKWYAVELKEGNTSFRCYVIKGEPVLSLARSGAFADGYFQVLYLVREAKAVIAARSRIVALLKRLRQTGTTALR